ncbi:MULTISPECIES: hypothetical protein [unclassified Methylobacterium]|uniref:hypothetical protein n=1 Tax=unclassified Methylobacterium TaxID=2615210 RepID=UPI00226A6A4C|nr:MULTISPECIES: hypothetical protein [unclassified Methylobacterium]
MTTSAERRARRRWQIGGPADPLNGAFEQLVIFAAAASRMSVVATAAGSRFAAAGGPTAAEAEALARWALPADAAFRRATVDLERLTGQLAAIACIDLTGDR